MTPAPSAGGEEIKKKRKRKRSRSKSSKRSHSNSSDNKSPNQGLISAISAPLMQNALMKSALVGW